MTQHPSLVPPLSLHFRFSVRTVSAADSTNQTARRLVPWHHEPSHGQGSCYHQVDRVSEKKGQLSGRGWEKRGRGGRSFGAASSLRNRENKIKNGCATDEMNSPHRQTTAHSGSWMLLRRERAAAAFQL